VPSVCANLVAKGQALVGTVTQFLGGTATGDQVRTAASDLSSAIDSAQAAIGAQTSARLDAAAAAVDRLLKALGAQPPDVTGMRTAANDAFTALRDAAAICQSAAPTASR
jgi:hypothetical protein